MYVAVPTHLCKCCPFADQSLHVWPDSIDGFFGVHQDQLVYSKACSHRLDERTNSRRHRLRVQSNLVRLSVLLRAYLTNGRGVRGRQTACLWDRGSNNRRYSTAMQTSTRKLACRRPCDAGGGELRAQLFSLSVQSTLCNSASPSFHDGLIQCFVF